MSVRRIFLYSLIVAVLAMLSACERSSQLKGQSNTTITFYGLAVDQSGKPLAGVQIRYQVEAYPKDWTFESRGRPYDVSTVVATSDSQGRLSFTVTGCHLRLTEGTRAGYRHFWEQDTSGDQPSTYGYQLIAWSDPWFRSDPEHPAVFVFVKEGVHEVSALLCKGGWESGGGKQWRLNKPGWPKKPSLPDVKYVGPATNSK